MSIFRLSSLLALFVFALSFVACGNEPGEPPAFDHNAWSISDQGDGDGDSEEEPIPRADGGACAENGDCMSGYCFTNGGWPDGHCTTPSCSSDVTCSGAPEAVSCLGHPDEGAICVRRCDLLDDDPCRSGYECRELDAHSGWCAPSSTPEPAPDFPFDIHCVEPFNGNATLNYTIHEDTTSYMIVPHSGGDGWLFPTRIETPSGNRIDFQGSNRFQLSMFAYYGINPIIVPVAPQFELQLEAGEHTMTVRTNDEQACFWLMESRGTPTKIDMNLYLVGLGSKNLTADNAENHTNFQQMLSTAEQILGQAGISFGEIRYLTVPQFAENNYRVIRSNEDIMRLLTFSEYIGPTADEARSINVFVTERFTYGPLGVSMGAPGVAGIHGSFLSGVVVSGEYIGSGQQGNRYTAVAFAHEIGHFLGLEHTSEQGGESFDFLDDTPRCVNYDNQRPWNCPDWGNLMFPLADFNNTDVSPGQAHVIQVSPLTR